MAAFGRDVCFGRDRGHFEKVHCILSPPPHNFRKGSPKCAYTSYVPASYVPTSYVPTSYVPTSYGPTSYVPTSHVPTSYVPTSYVLTSYVPTTYLPSTYLPTLYNVNRLKRGYVLNCAINLFKMGAILA